MVQNHFWSFSAMAEIQSSQLLSQFSDFTAVHGSTIALVFRGNLVSFGVKSLRESTEDYWESINEPHI